MITAKFFREFTRQFSESLPPSMQAFRAEFEQQLYRGFELAFAKLDLCTRQEFDIQTEVLARTREKLEKLEEKLDALSAMGLTRTDGTV